MCDCLNDIVEIAVCVGAGAIADADAPAELRSVASWAGHARSVDQVTTQLAPVHHAVALLNVPPDGPTAAWLVEDLAQLLRSAERSGLHPAWPAYGAVWLAHLGVAVGLASGDQALVGRLLDLARGHVAAVGGLCPAAVLAPPTPAELDEHPYAWLHCDEPAVALPDAGTLRAGALALEPGPIAGVPALVLGLRTRNTDDWRTWPSADLLRRVHLAEAPAAPPRGVLDPL